MKIVPIVYGRLGRNILNVINSVRPRVGTSFYMNPKPAKRKRKKYYTGKLYHADPNCKHELDPYCYSGIRCLKCNGWFCY